SFLAARNDATGRRRKSGKVVSEDIPYAGNAERTTTNSVAYRSAEANIFESSVNRASIDASTMSGAALKPTAVSGSFRPLPVSTHTTVEPFGTPNFNSPATDAADAGSQNTDSCRAM